MIRSLRNQLNIQRHVRQYLLISCRNLMDSSPGPPDASVDSNVKTRSMDEVKQQGKLCTAFCTGEAYDVTSIKSNLAESSLPYEFGILPRDAADIIYLKSKSRAPDEEGTVFLFTRLGASVTWNLTDIEVKTLRDFLKQCQIDSYPEELVNVENEQMNYCLTNIKSNLIDGDIYLNSESTYNVLELEKFAFSNAMALSVRSALWEQSLDRFVNSLKHLPIALKRGESIKMSRQEVMEKMGELLTLRHQINLYSDLLITPDFYWDREQLEDLFNKTCNYLEVGRRTRVMNEKLNLCSEMMEMLRSHLEERHTHRLEWMIIALITLEVIFEVIHLIEKYA